MTSSQGDNTGRGDPHGWNALDHYLAIHHRCLNDWRDHFIISDSLEYLLLETGLRIVGRITCAHALFLDVDKTLAINENNQVRTIRYSYHAGVTGGEDRPIFRYDNAHIYAREGHQDAHHRHRFDVNTWQEVRPPDWVGYQRWPHLNDVIEELSDWWRDNGQSLSELSN